MKHRSEKKERDLAEAKAWRLVVGLVAATFCPLGQAQSAGIIEERLFFPANIEGQVYQLDAVVYRPDDGGRHPLVINSHGRDGLYPARNPNQVWSSRELCEALAAEGLVVVSFARRGYGNSEGSDVELQDTAVNTGLEAAKDYQAAVEYWRTWGFVLPDKVALMGHSQGGWAVLACATVPMEGVLGVVNLSGGTNYALMGSGAVTSAVQNHWVTACAELGRDALVSSFWLYAENDPSISGPTARRMFEAHNGAGGWGFLLMLPPYGDNGHAVSRDPDLYLPQLNDFFATIGLRDEAVGPPEIVATTGAGSRQAGDTAVLTVQLTANPLPALQWRKDGANLANNAHVAGATSSALSVFNVQAGDAGDYTVVATNPFGTTGSDPITLSVATSSPPTTPTTPSSPATSGGGGGGGAVSVWFAAALGALALARGLASYRRSFGRKTAA